MAKGIYIAFGFQQLGVPVAWIISPFLVSTDSWSVLYTFELGLALCFSHGLFIETTTKLTYLCI